MSHGGHPKDWPMLECPECGHAPLLTPGYVLCVVIDCPGPAVRTYGDALITVPARDSTQDEPECFCNRMGCEWHGTIREAKQRKAENSNPTRVSEPSG